MNFDSQLKQGINPEKYFQDYLDHIKVIDHKQNEQAQPNQPIYDNLNQSQSDLQNQKKTSIDEVLKKSQVKNVDFENNYSQVVQRSNFTQCESLGFKSSEYFSFPLFNNSEDNYSNQKLIQEGEMIQKKLDYLLTKYPDKPSPQLKLKHVQSKHEKTQNSNFQNFIEEQKQKQNNTPLLQKHVAGDFIQKQKSKTQYKRNQMDIRLPQTSPEKQKEDSRLQLFKDYLIKRFGEPKINQILKFFLRNSEILEANTQQKRVQLHNVIGKENVDCLQILKYLVENQLKNKVKEIRERPKSTTKYQTRNFNENQTIIDFQFQYIL